MMSLVKAVVGTGEGLGSRVGAGLGVLEFVGVGEGVPVAVAVALGPGVAEGSEFVVELTALAVASASTVGVLVGGLDVSVGIVVGSGVRLGEGLGIRLEVVVGRALEISVSVGRGPQPTRALIQIIKNRAAATADPVRLPGLPRSGCSRLWFVFTLAVLVQGRFRTIQKDEMKWDWVGFLALGPTVGRIIARKRPNVKYGTRREQGASKSRPCFSQGRP